MISIKRRKERERKRVRDIQTKFIIFKECKIFNLKKLYLIKMICNYLI